MALFLDDLAAPRRTTTTTRPTLTAIQRYPTLQVPAPNAPGTTAPATRIQTVYPVSTAVPISAPTPVLRAAPPPPTGLQPQPRPDLPVPVPGRAAPEFLTPFGPGDDLRFQQINPVGSERQREFERFTGEAAEAVRGGPNLREAALQRLALLEEQSQPGFERALQDVGRRASALGRIGAGITTSELGDVTTQRERALSQARRGIASDLAEAEEAQRLGRLGAFRGLEEEVSGREAGRRGELRGEREFQAGTAREAQENRIRQRLLEEELLQGQFGRQVSRAQLGLLGAEQLGERAGAAEGTAADLLSQLALQDYLRRQRAAGGPYGVRGQGNPSFEGPQ